MSLKKAFINFKGDPSVGIFPSEVVIDLTRSYLIEDDEREDFRSELKKFFGEYFTEECSVQFDDECVDCGRKDIHSPSCPTALMGYK